jgi:hypothetical protein
LIHINKDLAIKFNKKKSKSSGSDYDSDDTDK